MVTKTLLQTYLGCDPGKRVHQGMIAKGQGVSARSVIWFSDVRGFTKRSDKCGRIIALDVVNTVFGLTEKAMTKHGGEMLKFMGDGCMAIFPEESSVEDDAALPELGEARRDGSVRKGTAMFDFTDSEKLQGLAEEKDQDEEELGSRASCALITGDGEDATKRARLATLELQQLIRKKSYDRAEKGLPEIGVGVGLHFGTCSHGNVGGESRLDFTVIRPAVNLASRAESLCGKLDACALATKTFVKLDEDSEDGDWTFRGTHEVKGVSQPVDVFQLDVQSEAPQQ